MIYDQKILIYCLFHIIFWQVLIDCTKFFIIFSSRNSFQKLFVYQRNAILQKHIGNLVIHIIAQIQQQKCSLIWFNMIQAVCERQMCKNNQCYTLLFRILYFAVIPLSSETICLQSLQFICYITYKKTVYFYLKKLDT